MADEPNATDTSTDDGGHDFVSGLADDSVSVPENTDGDGANGSGEDANKNPEDHSGDDAASKETPAETPVNGDPQEFKYVLNPEHREYLAARGVLAEKGVDVDKMVKDMKEKDKYFSEVNAALSNTRAQLQSIKANNKNKPSPTKEEIRNAYNESFRELDRHYRSLQTALKIAKANPGEFGDDISVIEDQMESLQQMDAKNQSEMQKQLDEVQKIELRKELGLSLPNSDDISADKAKAVANENFEKLLRPEDIANKEYMSKLIAPMQPLIHHLAAAIYPNMYDSENPSSEQSQEAIHRVMMNEQIAQIAVDYGKSKMVSDGADADKKSFGVQEYNRGREDMRREINAGGPSPTSSPAKKMVVAKAGEKEDGGVGFVSDLISVGDR